MALGVVEFWLVRTLGLHGFATCSNSRAIGFQKPFRHGMSDPKPCYLGTWTLQVGIEF